MPEPDAEPPPRTAGRRNASRRPRSFDRLGRVLRRSLLAATAVALLLPLVGAAETLASWNIRHLGHGAQKHYPALGEVVRLGNFDFVAVQEAMTDEGVAALVDAIEHSTGADWEAMISHSLGRGSYKEKYAFLWNSETIEYVDGAVVYLDVTDRFMREPYSARFRIKDSGRVFVAATVHIVYGQRVSDRTPEIAALAEYWRWLEEVYPEDRDRLLLMGDFNLRPSHTGWAPLRVHAAPLIVSDASTLSSIDGRYANLYDNIWAPEPNDLGIVAAGVFRFPAKLELTHEQARRHVSDHAPVSVKLDVVDATRTP